MPVEVATDLMLNIAKKDEALGQIFHICNPHEFLVSDILKQAFSALNLNIKVVSATKLLAKLYLEVVIVILRFASRTLRSVSRRMSYFKWYVLEESHYDMTNTRKMASNWRSKTFDFPTDYIYNLTKSFCNRPR